MCVAFWALDHPDYALILCSNRDEYLSRPTTNAHFHSFGGEPISDGGDVLSGRDLRAGGTWLGMNTSGKVALLTNITEPYGQYTSSRGQLVSSFLLGDPAVTSLQDDVNRIASENNNYAGFNLLLLSPSHSSLQRDGVPLSLDAIFVSNSGGGGEIISRPLTGEEKHCGGMSNGIDRHGASDWPKVQHGVQALQEILPSISEDTLDLDLAEQLFTLLTWKSDRQPGDRSELRNTIHIEPLCMPSALPSVHEFYGTRLSTVILVRRDKRVLFIERDIWKLTPEGKAARANTQDDRVFRFTLEVQSLKDFNR